MYELWLLSAALCLGVRPTSAQRWSGLGRRQVDVQFGPVYRTTPACHHGIAALAKHRTPPSPTTMGSHPCHLFPSTSKLAVKKATIRSGSPRFDKAVLAQELGSTFAVSVQTSNLYSLGFARGLSSTQ